MLLEESGYSTSLIRWDGINVAEATSWWIVYRIWVSSRIVDSTFRLEDGLAGIDFCGSHARNVGASARPSWIEDIKVWAQAACWSVDGTRIVCSRSVKALALNFEDLLDTPESPEANKKETPWSPNFMYSRHWRFWYEMGTSDSWPP